MEWWPVCWAMTRSSTPAATGAGTRLALIPPYGVLGPTHHDDTREGSMSDTAIAQVVDRASADAKFLTELERDPERALAGYDLTEAERAAIRQGAVRPLQELGAQVRASTGAEDAGPPGTAPALNR